MTRVQELLSPQRYFSARGDSRPSPLIVGMPLWRLRWASCRLIIRGTPSRTAPRPSERALDHGVVVCTCRTHMPKSASPDIASLLIPYSADLILGLSRRPLQPTINRAQPPPPVCENAATADSTALSLEGKSGSPSATKAQSFVACDAAKHKSQRLAVCAFPVKHRENRDGFILDHVLLLFADAGTQHRSGPKLSQHSPLTPGLSLPYMTSAQAPPPLGVLLIARPHRSQSTGAMF